MRVFFVISLFLTIGETLAQTTKAIIYVHDDGSVKVETVAPAPSIASRRLATNLNFPTDYDPTQLLANARRSTRAFGSADHPYDGSAALDANGWPLGDWGMVIAVDFAHVNGTWKLRMKGKTNALAVSNGMVENVLWSDSTKTTTADLVVSTTQPAPIFLSVRGAGNQEIEVTRPNCQRSDVFNPHVINLLRDTFPGGVRLMDAMGTNQTRVVKKSDRALPTDIRVVESKGLSLEEIAQLANLIKIPIWINIPATADDDCIAFYGKFLDENVASDQIIYVEYSNETWNGGFEAAGICRARAKASVEAGDADRFKAFADAYFVKLWGPGAGNTNDVHWGWLYPAKRTADIKRLFPQKSRFKFLLASQKGYDPPGFLIEMQLSYLESQYGPAKNTLHAIACAPYYGPGDEYMRNSGATKNGILDRLWVSAQTASKDAQTLAFHKTALTRGLKSFAYEGGDHMRPGFGAIHETNVAPMIEAIKDPALTLTQGAYLTNWYTGGGDLFAIFNLATLYDRSGTWGQTNDIYWRDAPKMVSCRNVTAWLRN